MLQRIGGMEIATYEPRLRNPWLRMRGPWRHSPTYHPWRTTTPVLDAILAIVAAASIVIGGHAALFLVIAMRDADGQSAVDCGAFLVAIAVVNGLLDCLRNWRRHHG